MCRHREKTASYSQRERPGALLSFITLRRSQSTDLDLKPPPPDLGDSVLFCLSRLACSLLQQPQHSFTQVGEHSGWGA